MEKNIFIDVQKLLLLDPEENTFDNAVLHIFEKYNIKYHNHILKYFLFIYNNFNLLQKLLELNISLLQYIQDINPIFEMNYNLIINKNNISIIQKNISQIYIIDILYYLSDRNLKMIFTKDKYIFPLFFDKHNFKFFKYIQNINSFIRLIKNYNINNYLFIMNKNNFFQKLDESQKNVVLFKIQKFIYDNPQNIIYVEKLLDVKTIKYKQFILQCSKKNLKIFQYLELNDYFFEQIFNNLKSVHIDNMFFFQKKCNIIIDTLFQNKNNKLSEKLILKYIVKFPYLIYHYDITSSDFIIKLIYKLIHDKNTLRFVIEYCILYHGDYRKYFENANVAYLLISNDTCYYTELFLHYIDFKFDLNLICRILNTGACYCVITLYNLFIYDINKYDLLTMIQCNPNVLFKYDKKLLIDCYGGPDFIKSCIETNAFCIRYFKDDFFSYKELVYSNSFILEHIDYKELKELFIYCIKNINRNDYLYISNDTYNKYFLDVCNAYFLLHLPLFPTEINKQIYLYLL